MALSSSVTNSANARPKMPAARARQTARTRPVCIPTDYARRRYWVTMPKVLSHRPTGRKWGVGAPLHTESQLGSGMDAADGRQPAPDRGRAPGASSDPRAQSWPAMDAGAAVGAVAYR